MQLLKALGWVWAIWLVVSLVAMVSRSLVAFRLTQFVFSHRYRPLLENSRAGKRCVGKRYLTAYGSLILVNLGLFWLCFQNFFPSGWRIPLIDPIFNMLIILLGLTSVVQTATVMISSSTVEAHLAEQDPDADSW